MKLIVPIAGRSSRFKNVRPKWMLTHPNGRFMVSEAISGLNLKNFEEIYFVGLAEHEEKFQFSKGLKEELHDLGLLNKSEIVLLEEPTSCQPETVSKLIEIKKLEGFVFIKDSDNFFNAEVRPVNQICYFTLNETSLINPKNKSYINLDANGNILNIVEKNVIGPNFSVGGYGFEDAQKFLRDFAVLQHDLPNQYSKEIYISDIIYHSLLNGLGFIGNKVTEYLDWGTAEDWERYKKSYLTLFIDLDGTLVVNSSKHFPPYIGNTKPLQKNVNFLRTLKESRKVHIIITTSRPEKFRRETEKQLSENSIPYDQLIMGLFHSKRLIINDYSNSNTYKTCDAINMKRDTEDLEELLKDIIEA